MLMTDYTKKLGIIAGGGVLPLALIEFCQSKQRDFFVLAIEGNAQKDVIPADVPQKWIRIGQAGTGFKIFKDEKVQEVNFLSKNACKDENICYYIKVVNR